MHFLLPLLLLLTQTLAQLQYVPFTDGSYAWRLSRRVGALYPGQVRDAAQAAYQGMIADAREKRKDPPAVMAALYIPTSQGGVLVVASSIKRAHGESVATENICSGQHHHGNCAEMNAFALVDHSSMSCRGSYIAAYGRQGNHLTFMPPCRDRDGHWGCASYCTQQGITPLTKRSRVEGNAQGSSEVLERTKNIKEPVLVV